MRSDLIEFFRFDDQDSGMLRRGDRFLRARGNEPVTEVEIPIQHRDFLRRLDQLRYQVQNDSDRRDEALRALAEVVTQVLGVCATPDEPTQIDLVTNAAELSALPFELARDADDRPVFAVSEPPLVLTRRVRTAPATSGGPRRACCSPRPPCRGRANRCRSSRTGPRCATRSSRGASPCRSRA
jgi:hypothetical protein